MRKNNYPTHPTSFIQSLPSYKIAARAHEGQLYGSKPYLYHIQQTAETVLRHSKRACCEDSIILLVHLANLHDVLEDTDLTEKDIRKELAGYKHLDHLINSLRLITKGENEKREDYLKRCKSDYFSRKVKMADTLANFIECIRQDDQPRADKYQYQLEFLSFNF